MIRVIDFTTGMFHAALQKQFLLFFGIENHISMISRIANMSLNLEEAQRERHDDHSDDEGI